MIQTRKFAIVITCYNKAEYISECLTFALEQGVNVIVVDDASNDGSRKIIETFPNVISCFHDHNSGATAANITGIKKAEESGADFVVLIDGDDVLAPTSIDHFKKVICETGVDAIYPALQRSAEHDMRNMVTPCDIDADIRIEDDPVAFWLKSGFAYGAVCARPSALLAHIDPSVSVQDHQIAFSVHWCATKVAFSKAVTHYCSKAKPGNNLSFNNYEKDRSYIRLFMNTYHLVSNHTHVHAYIKRSYNRALRACKLKEHVRFGDRLWLALIRYTVKGLVPTAFKVRIIQYVDQILNG